MLFSLMLLMGGDSSGARRITVAPAETLLVTTTGRGQPLLIIPGLIGGYLPTWSPDGSAIAGESPGGILRVDIQGGKTTVLASGLCRKR